MSGKCVVATCPEGFKDCNETVADGCEMDVRTDSANCGECKRACGSEGAKSAACVAGKCELVCKAGLSDCNGNGADGCETSVWKDAKNCGHCGVTCDTTCVEGLCAPVVLVSGVAARFLTAHGGSVFYFDEGARRISRVSAGEKPASVVDGVAGLTGLRAVGDRLVWATPAGVFARSIGAQGAPVERISTAFAGETPVVSSQTGYVSWAVRAPAAAAGAKAKKATKHAPVGPEGRQVVAALLGERGKPSLSVAECNEWPRTFAADDRDVFCCDEGTPLASIACSGGKCTHHDLGVLCPENLVMAAERVYFGADVRVLALDRKSNVVTVLAKRKRYPRDVVAAGSNLYWMEGGTDLYRLRLDASPAATAELVARRMTDVVGVAADDMGAYWIARAAGANAGAAAGAKDETYAIYALSVGERPQQ